MRRVTQITDFLIGHAFCATVCGKGSKSRFSKDGAQAWRHSVADLLNELSKSAPVPVELFDAALELDKAYISNRYTNAHPSGSPFTRYTCGEAEKLIHMQRTSSGSVKVFYPKLTKDEVIKILSERLMELNKMLPLVKVVLFGSYAKGNYTVGSDIDLLIIYDGEKRSEDYALVKKILDLPRLEPHIYTLAEYQQMRDMIQKMTKEGIEFTA